jgi:prepilin-type N-terminal cleavage/methylation domain-containing protein
MICPKILNNISHRSKKGFTLIELLIVIVIIGILAGVLLTVISPAKQQRKAKEASMRSNVEKMCLALHACGSSTEDSTRCDDVAGLGVTLPLDNTQNYIPRGAKYALISAGSDLTGDYIPGGPELVSAQSTTANLFDSSSSAYEGDKYDRSLVLYGFLDTSVSGSTNTCLYYCGYNFKTGVPISMKELKAIPMGGTDGYGCLVD